MIDSLEQIVFWASMGTLGYVYAGYSLLEKDGVKDGVIKDGNENTLLKEKVLLQSLALRNVREKKSRLDSIAATKQRPEGVMNKLFFELALFFGTTGVNLAQRKRLAAKEILSVGRIRSMICSSLISPSSLGRADDATIVQAVVDVLADPLLRDEYSIPYDEELFGACCDEIFMDGVTKFCSKK